MSLNHEDVVQILALLDASHFDELRLETAGYKLHLRRSAAGVPAHGGNEAGTSPAVPVPTAVETPAAPAPQIASAPQNALAAQPASAPNVSAPPASVVVESARTTTAVKAPMLGTFYGAPQPGAAPFVTVGSTVEPDSVIGIVEVMKLMNAVSAGTSGVVVEIVAKDGTLVEYGEVLLRVAPAAS